MFQIVVNLFAMFGLFCFILILSYLGNEFGYKIRRGLDNGINNIKKKFEIWEESFYLWKDK